MSTARPTRSPSAVLPSPSATSPAFDQPGLLDPLDGLAIPAPFSFSAHPFPTMLPIDDSEAPIDPQATPRAPAQVESLLPPPAPLPKDLDSFSEGTGVGSFADFDYVPDVPAESGADDYPFDDDESHEPLLAIEHWRTDVHQQTEYGIAVELRRRRLPTPPPEEKEPANKRRRVSELALADVLPFVPRARSLQPDPPPNALGVTLVPRPVVALAIVRPASAPPMLKR